MTEITPPASISNTRKIQFTKMHGAGNDFILISAWHEEIKLSRQLVAKLCNRRFGIGADGLMMLSRPTLEAADVRMNYFNADGGEAEMCGNGARCFARFVKNVLNLEKSCITIQTAAGLVSAECRQNFVRIKMPHPSCWRAPHLLEVLDEKFSVAFVNTGVPHVVLRVSDLENTDVCTVGSAIRHHPEFAPAGTNVNFFDFASDGTILLRTYERGVEDETLACGTGVLATALVANRYHSGVLPASVRVRSGEILLVEEPSENCLYLSGPASFVFQGQINISYNSSHEIISEPNF